MENVFLQKVRWGKILKQFRQSLFTVPALIIFISVPISASLPAGEMPGTSSIEPLVLKAETLPFTPKEFYILDLVDERKNPTRIGLLLPSGNNTGEPAAPQAVDLHGGGKNAIFQFVKKSLPQNKSLRPLIVRLQECEVTESVLDKNRVEGNVAVSMSFEYQKEDGSRVHLTEYSGGSRYIRASTRHTTVESALRQSLAGALTYLNTWMDREAATNVKLARGVKIFFREYTENVEDDTVFYDPKRPLVWDDFRGKPSSRSQYEASVFPNFKYVGHSEVKDGFVHLYLTMKAFMIKDYSWVKAGERNSYALNHEQRHFDLTKLIAERFKKKIQSRTWSVDDYEGLVGYEYIVSYREMNKLQEQYDQETSHGMNRMAQESWNQKIDEELRAFSVKE